MNQAMFDMETLKDIRRTADEISYTCMNRHYYTEVENLKKALDHVCRVLGTFADIEMHRLNGHYVAYDPQAYIKGRLQLAYDAIKVAPTDDQFPA
jgi:hypothetical protein